MRLIDVAFFVLAAFCAFVLGAGFWVAFRGGEFLWVVLGIVGVAGFLGARELFRFSQPRERW